MGLRRLLAASGFQVGYFMPTPAGHDAPAAGTPHLMIHALNPYGSP